MTADAINSCYSSICDGVVKNQAKEVSMMKIRPLTISVTFGPVFLSAVPATKRQHRTATAAILMVRGKFSSIDLQTVVADVDCVMSADEVQSDWPTVEEGASSTPCSRLGGRYESYTCQRGCGLKLLLQFTCTEASRLTGDSGPLNTLS